MIMRLACKEHEPSLDCKFEAVGEDAKEVAKKMLAHMKSAHPDAIEEMNTSDEEMMKKFASEAHE